MQLSLALKGQLPDMSAAYSKGDQARYDVACVRLSGKEMELLRMYARRCRLSVSDAMRELIRQGIGGCNVTESTMYEMQTQRGLPE